MKDNSPDPTRPNNDYYRIPATESESELKVSGSRFIGRVFVVESEEVAAERIAIVRKAEYDATHHCTAYRVGVEEFVDRYNDDGEPSGTAGPPILRRIEASGLTNILVVVTRYYGGTKLGTGGLIRAYGESAQLAIDRCGERKHAIEECFKITFAYDDTSVAMHLVSKFDGRIVSTEYGAQTLMTAAFRRSFVPQIEDAFTEASGGRILVERSKLA